MIRVLAVAGMLVLLAAVAAHGTPSTAPTAAPQLSVPKRQQGWTVWQTSWPTIPGAAVYQIFLEGVAAGIQIPSTPAGPRQGYSIPVTCGTRHKINARAGDTTAKNGSAAGWGPFGTPQYWTTPPC